MTIVHYLPDFGESQSLDGRPLLVTPQGGRVAVDALLLEIWHYAQGRNLSEIVAHFEHLPADGVRAALACLAEGGLLSRQETESSSTEPVSEVVWGDEMVSVVVVSFNSRSWLEICLPSLDAQTWQNLEIIVVDNDSSDDTLPWLRANYPGVHLLEMPVPSSLAAAINTGVRAAKGDFFLLLNPDVRLEPDAVARMVDTARRAPDIAAVAPKLRFLYAPAFLNGIGNRVGRFSFGVDNALGHLDLGQFDHWRDLPSACFAATLIPRQAWNAVGALDEDFPLYYEDSEWSYRARLMGWCVLADPQAVVYHAYGGHIAGQSGLAALPAHKLERASWGRYRFAYKIPAVPRRFLWTYAVDDLLRFGLALLRDRWDAVQVHFTVWRRVWRQRRSLRAAHRDVQSRRTVDDVSLFGLQREMPPPHVWRGLPELTWELVLDEYLPLMKSDTTSSVPEFSSDPVRLLIVSHDVVDEKMAGPGMRYLEMARALQGQGLLVTLAIPGESALKVPDV
ncbi:MAG TPA: glycosyltransferase family 2 protein, partial [Anaerolineales bacterium]|nr:glycosyltransferase family 2 protein [Anaerolineales bacterium]